MRLRYSDFLAALALLFAVERTVVAGPIERSISSSHQFIVYGGDVQLRGAICDAAERTKRNLLLQIDQRDEWTTPIVINTQFPQANLPETPRAALNFSQTGFGLKLQLDLTIDALARRPEIERELLRAILLEIIYRHEPDIAAGDAYISPPDWLLDGILSLEANFDRTPLLEPLQSMVAAHKIVPLDEFLRQQPDLLDAPGRSLYRAYSFVLLEFVIQVTNGRPRLVRFIQNLPSFADPVENFRTYFPELINRGGGTATAWVAAVTRVCGSSANQFLTAAETEVALDRLLHLTIADRSENVYLLEDFNKLARTSGSRPALIGLSRDLIALAMQANPIYRPAVEEYIQIAALVIRGKTRRVAARLRQVKQSHENIAGRLRHIDDYLNWLEATQPRTPSGAFADYLKAADLRAAPERRRHDPISVYLDTMKTQFQD
ncbi:MAG: hypothetical protein M3O66_07410 [Verrucomicrobiota bacterium]|nr:hypothetical protein [Verrucomicrobiota bacterium]